MTAPLRVRSFYDLACYFENIDLNYKETALNVSSDAKLSAGRVDVSEVNANARTRECVQ